MLHTSSCFIAVVCILTEASYCVKHVPYGNTNFCVTSPTSKCLSPEVKNWVPGKDGIDLFFKLPTEISCNHLIFKDNTVSPNPPKIFFSTFNVNITNHWELFINSLRFFFFFSSGEISTLVTVRPKKIKYQRIQTEFFFS